MNPEPVTYEVGSPIQYVRGDGKYFWRPCILRMDGSGVTQELAMNEYYDGWLEENIRWWENMTPGYSSTVELRKIIPRLYSSRKKAIRVSKRVVKKYNKEQLMIIRKV